MDLTSGLPYWLIRDGLPKNYPRLEDDVTCDVAVIGGGISGALHAFELTQLGLKVVVLDRRSVSLGSTCASTSLIQYETDCPLFKLKQLIGDQKADLAYQSCVAALTDLQKTAARIRFGGLQRTTSLYFAASKGDTDHVQKEFRARRAAGIRVRLLTTKDTFDKYGFKCPAAIESADGLTFDSYLFTHALLQWSARRGAQIFERTDVSGIKERPNEVLLKTARGHTIQCRYLVNAGGYESYNILPASKIRLVSTYAIATEQIDPRSFPWRKAPMMWNTARPYLYLREADHRLIVGGRDAAVEDPRKRDALLKAKTAALTRDAQKLFPELDIQPAFSWCGTFAETADSLPYIGLPKRKKRQFFALGYGGNGIVFSAIAAKIISQKIIGKDHPLAGLFAFNR